MLRQRPRGGVQRRSVGLGIKLNEALRCGLHSVMALLLGELVNLGLCHNTVRIEQRVKLLPMQVLQAQRANYNPRTRSCAVSYITNRNRRHGSLIELCTILPNHRAALARPL